VGFFVFPQKISEIGTATEAPRRFMATPDTNQPAQPHAGHRLPINVDLVAIAIGLTLAALIRFGVIHQITF
jgi:hypothetical protein